MGPRPEMHGALGAGRRKMYDIQFTIYHYISSWQPWSDVLCSVGRLTTALSNNNQVLYIMGDD